MCHTNQGQQAATATNLHGEKDELIRVLRATVDAEDGDNGRTSAPATAGGDLAEQPGAILTNTAGDSPNDLALNDLSVLNTTTTDTDLDPAVVGGLAAPPGALEELRLRPRHMP